MFLKISAFFVPYDQIRIASPYEHRTTFRNFPNKWRCGGPDSEWSVSLFLYRYPGFESRPGGGPPHSAI